MEEKTKTTLAKDKNEFVSGVITTKEGRILVFKRKQNLKLDPGKWDFCSGHIKEGEAPTQAMYRELNEEIGLMPEQVKLEKIGIIGTPHEKLENTLTHIYHIETIANYINFNEMIENVQQPEFEVVFDILDISTLKNVIENSRAFRMKYTKQMKYALEAIEQKMKKTKEEGIKKECEER